MQRWLVICTRRAVSSMMLPHIRTLKTDSCREIVGDSGEEENPFDQFPSAMLGLAQASDSLAPPEWLFDPLSLSMLVL